jgi:O-antigen/teichoic acid export membrane protein
LEHIQISAPLKHHIKQLLTSPTLRVITGLAGGNLLAISIGLIGSLIQVRFVSPEDLGYFDQFSIASGYIFFLTLGIFEAVQRLYPFYIGKGQKDKAIATAEIGQAWNLSVSALVSAGFVLLAIYSMLVGNWRAALGWLAQVVFMTSTIYGGYLNATYRSGHDFSNIAKSSVISSLTSLAFLPFVVVWPYIGLVMRSSFGSLASLIYLHFHRPLKLSWRFNWTEWLIIIKQGLPIFIAGYASTTLWSVTECAIILGYLGTKSLGFWAITIMVIEMANKVPQAIVAVYIPRVTELFGRTESVAECIRLSRKPVLWGVPGTLLLAVLGSAVLPFIVPILMPKYLNAIPVISVALFILPLMVLELPNTILVAMGKVVQQNISSFAGLGSFVILAFVAYRLGWGLIGIAVASLLGRVVRLFLIYMFVFIASKKPASPVAQSCE